MQNLQPYLELTKMMTLATKDEYGNPYTSNVYFGYHPETYTCYFISRPMREHSKHILKDNCIAWSIFNTEKYHPTDKDKKGLQFQGVCKILDEITGKEVFEKYYHPRIEFRDFPQGHIVFACIPRRVKIWDESLYGGEGKIIEFK